MKDTDLKVLVVGGGAREHALVWKINQSPRVKQIYCAPGNAGTGLIAQNLAIEATDIKTLVKAGQELGIDLVVVGPEGPLALGLVDALKAVGISAFGPTAVAARLEVSKAFARGLMEAYGVPCARGRVFQTYFRAKQYLDSQVLPLVVKADGLTLGKGVKVAFNRGEALEFLRKIMIERVFGEAGDWVVIEEYLMGKETSVIAFCDGKTIILLPPACDYKRLSNWDIGPNTGGMGGYCPSEFITPGMLKQIKEAILEKAVEAMAKEGRSFQGVLYAGLMITDGGARVLEFNVRFGDPETQSQIPLLKTDLVDIMLATINGTLDQIKIEWSKNKVCASVVIASEGYPEKPITGREITGLDKIDPDIIVFHAGTAKIDGKIISAGGRVLTLSCVADSLAKARQKIYGNIPKIGLEGCRYREDIAMGERVTSQVAMEICF